MRTRRLFVGVAAAGRKTYTLGQMGAMPAATNTFDHVRALMEDDRLLDAAEEFQRIRTDLGLAGKLAMAIGDCIRTARSIERDVLMLTREQYTRDRRNLFKELWMLSHEAEGKAEVPPPPDWSDAPSLPTGRPSTTKRRSATPSPNAPRVEIVSCEGVRKRYGERFELGPVSLSLGFGELLVVVGANASGKTSLLRILAGELIADEGTCVHATRDEGGRKIEVLAMMVPESPPAWSGRLRDHLSWQAALFGYRTKAENEARVNEALLQLDIEKHEDKPWSKLSDGIRMRAAIAAVVIANPRMVILDEPLGPLDPLSQQDLLRWMHGYAKGDRRTSFIISAHHVTEVEAVADWVLSLQPGKACEALQPEEIPLPAKAHIRLLLLPGADTRKICEHVAALGGDVRIDPKTSYVLVQAPHEHGAKLSQMASELAPVGVGAIQDLSRSALRTLLWREEP